MESIGLDLRQMQRTPLHPAHVEALRIAGREVAFVGGEIVAAIRDPMDRFFYVLEGEIEIVHPYSSGRLLAGTIGPTQFTGEIAFLCGGVNGVAMRATSDTRAISVERDAMLRFMAETPA